MTPPPGAAAEGERDFERGQVVTAAELRAHLARWPSITPAAR